MDAVYIAITLAIASAMSVILFNLGTLISAKLFGVRVERVSVGFPPRAFGKTIGETDYCISWIPLGGYVKMAGMIEDLDTTAKTVNRWEYLSKPLWQRLIIVIAGPLLTLTLGLAGTIWYKNIDFSTYLYETLVIVAIIIASVILLFVKEGMQTDADRRVFFQRSFLGSGLLSLVIYGVFFCMICFLVNEVMPYLEAISSLTQGETTIVKMIASQFMITSWKEFHFFGSVILVWFGLINLLPSLNGGNIIFLISEALTGRPVVIKTRLIVHQISMLLLLVLMMFVIINEIRGC